MDHHNSERVLKGASYVPLRNAYTLPRYYERYRQASKRAGRRASERKEVRKSRHSTHKNTNARQRDRRPRPAKITLQEILLTGDVERGKFAEKTTAAPTTDGKKKRSTGEGDARGSSPRPRRDGRGKVNAISDCFISFRRVFARYISRC